MAVVTAPQIVQPQNPGDVVGLLLENTTSAAQPAEALTFGQVFADGDVPAGTQLVAIINGQRVTLQMDVKATNPDGSVRFALLTLEAPALPPGAQVNVMLA